jgi:hypothetical protein
VLFVYIATSQQMSKTFLSRRENKIVAGWSDDREKAKQKNKMPVQLF